MEPNSQLEQEQWLRYVEGDRSAETELLIQYVGLVDSVVGQLKRRLPSHVRADDLRASALEGLWKAIRGFSTEQKVPFESYARMKIRGAVLDELRRNDEMTRTRRQQFKLAQNAYTTHQNVVQTVSLDENDRMEWLVDDSSLSPEMAAELSSQISDINQALSKLSEQEKLVLALVFNEDLNLTEAAEVLSLSRSRVSAIYNQALKRLKGMMVRSCRHQK